MGTIVAKMALPAQLAAAIGAAALLTVLGPVTSTLSAAPTSPALEVALETTATVIAVLSALLVHARYGRSGQRSDLALSTALAVFAVASACVFLVPALAPGLPEPRTAWAGLLGHGLGAALLAAAALMPMDEVRRPALARPRWLAGRAIALAAIAAAVVLVGDALPARSALNHAFVGHPASVGLEAAIMVLLAGAAVGFARRAATAEDGLMTWLAIGAILGTSARVNYVAYPSMPTDGFSTGDALRLAFFLCLLAGGAAEIRRAQRALTATTVEEERRRIARDLHDGPAQDLAFILHVARRLSERDRLLPELGQLATAAQRALDSTRHAITALAHPSDEPLTSALRRTAQEIAEREGARADVEGALDVSVSAATRDSLCLLVREAVTNALRHGGARTVRVSVENAAELRLRISDDGRGFDPELARQSVGRLGLRGMGQRVGQLGGDLQITSQPGHGTEVLVVLP